MQSRAKMGEVRGVPGAKGGTSFKEEVTCPV